MKKPPSCSKNLFFLILSLPFFFSVPSFAQSIEDRRPSDFGRTWQDLPIVPELNENSLRILKAGIAASHNPHAFSKVGDCDTSTDWYWRILIKIPDTIIWANIEIDLNLFYLITRDHFLIEV